jgi:hypothetical protein
MAALDSTMFESHHVSGHFAKRCKQSERQRRKKQRKRRGKQQQSKSPCSRPAQRKTARQQGYLRQARVVKRLPKLSLAVHAASHVILAARTSTGIGADQRHLLPLLEKSTTRMSIRIALADAGYDSESNHLAARRELGVRTLIPATTGRPCSNPRKGYYRRQMRRRLKAGPDKRCYKQRWQVETVNSMIKRNLGSACRARSTIGRKKDMLLRAVTHNIMILAKMKD